MEESVSISDPLRKAKPPAGRVMRVINFFSGMGLATVLLLLLGILTWLATLEQIDKGLYPTLNKYFHWKAFFLFPEIEGFTIYMPLPGGYWVSALLLLNLTLGGILRIRKGRKQIGVLISHFGIIFMLVAGGVAHHFSERGNMAVGEGQSSNTAEDYFEYVVEVAEAKDGKPGNIHVIRGDYLTDLTNGRTRIFKFPGFPFDLEIGGYLGNAQPVHRVETPPIKGELVADEYYLWAKEDEKQIEANTAGCHVRVLYRDGKKSPPFLMAGASFQPFTLKLEDRVFTVDMRKRLWPMPFTVHLDKFTADFHPGTGMPSKFVSNITRLENGAEAKFTIQMNEPMRYEGLTFYQASYGPQGAKKGDKMFSVFEVVRNPADAWPLYSLLVVGTGLAIHFVMKLGNFIVSAARKKSHV